MKESVTSKNYRHTKPRLALIMESKEPVVPPEVTDPKEIESTVLANVQADSYYVRHELPDVYLDQFEESGLMFSEFLLSHVRSWCSLDERDDDLILSVLNDIAKRGKLKFFRVSIDKNIHYNDVTFKVETGRAIRSFKGLDAPRLTTIRYYSEQPMTRKERSEPHTILDVKARVEEIRRQRDDYFKTQFGWSNELVIEKALYREKIEEEAQLKSAILKIAKKLGEKGA